MRDTPALLTATMNVADRCDRCGAQAFMSATQPGKARLLFCQHHGRAHAHALRNKGFVIVDETNLIPA